MLLGQNISPSARSRRVHSPLRGVAIRACSNVFLFLFDSSPLGDVINAGKPSTARLQFWRRGRSRGSKLRKPSPRTKFWPRDQSGVQQTGRGDKHRPLHNRREPVLERKVHLGNMQSWCRGILADFLPATRGPPHSNHVDRGRRTPFFGRFHSEITARFIFVGRASS